MMRHMNYKPGYYLTYFIYCMIPVSIYVWYLCRRRNEDKNEVNDVEIIFIIIASSARLDLLAYRSLTQFVLQGYCYEYFAKLITCIIFIM